MDSIPPPPKRSVAPSTSTSSTASTTIWEKSKRGWDRLYGVAAVVGGYSNALSAKIGMEAFFPQTLAEESSKAARILRTFTLDAKDLPEEPLIDARKHQKVIKKIPPCVIEQCQGLAIFTVMRTGFLVSGAGGSGVVLARLADGSFSAPSGIILHTLGVGFMAGADVYDVVLILRTKESVQSFCKPRITLGGEVSISAGPVGNGVMLESGLEGHPVWSYVKSKGIYAGVQIDGNVMISRSDENARAYYQPDIKAEQILTGEVQIPSWCLGLHETIRAAEGKSYQTSIIPRGPSTSELDSPTSSASPTSARRLPVVESYDEEDLLARRELQEAMKEYGLDPLVNVQGRENDALMISGEELELLSERFDEVDVDGEETQTPELSGTEMSSRASSMIYPLSIVEDLLVPTPSIAVGNELPPLPQRRSVDSPILESPVVAAEVVAAPVLPARRNTKKKKALVNVDEKEKEEEKEAEHVPAEAIEMQATVSNATIVSEEMEGETVAVSAEVGEGVSAR